MKWVGGIAFFWAIVIVLLGARIALHDQIALGASPVGTVLALLGH